MASAGTVTVDFAAETAKFTAELKSVNARLKSIESGFQSLERAAKRAFAALSVGALSSFIKAAGEAADQLGKSADKVGLSTRSYKAFEVAASEAGVSIETTSKILLESQKRLGEAATGTGKAKDVLKQLGLNVQQLQTLKPDQLFAKYADAINSLSTRSEQLAAANALMGKSVNEAFNLIQGGSGAIEEAAQFVDRFGLAIDRVSIKQIEAANDNIARLGLISKGAGQQIAAGLAPFFDQLSTSIQNATGSTEGFRTAAELVGSTVQVSFGIAANAAHAVEAAFFAVAGVAADVLAAIVEIGIRASVMVQSPSSFFNPQVQEAMAKGVEKATASLKASSDVNLANAEAALAKIQSIAQIQAGVLQTLEDSRAKAEAAVAVQNARDAAAAAGGKTLAGDPIGLSAQQNFDAQNDAAAAAAEAQKEILRGVTAANLEELDRRSAAFRNSKAFEVAEEAKAQAAIKAVRATTTDAAIGLLQALGQKNKAFAIASIVLEKALAIQRLLIQNQVAAGLAFASQLVPGDPTSLARAAAAAAAVRAQGFLAAGLIAATGALQIADVTSGGGRSAPGTALNPAFVQQGTGSGGQFGATSQNAVQVIIAGNVGIDQRMIDQVVAGIREAADDRDVIIFGPNSRQAQELVKVG